VKSPEAVSNAASTPRATALVPNTPEKLTRGFAFRPTLALMPAWGCKYWSSTWNKKLNKTQIGI
jgi:hypothetical protein